MTRASRTARPAAILALGFALCARSAAASPDTLRGVGARGQALAGANLADADDGAAVLENPAGIATAPGTSVSSGFSHTSSALRHDGAPAGLESVQTWQLGLVVPGAVRDVPVAFGLHLALPDGRLSYLHQVRPSEPYFPLDDAGPRLLDLGAVLALTPLPHLSLGAGIGFLASLDGGFEVTGTAVVADGSGSEYGSTLSHGVDAELRATRYLLAGLRYEAGKLRAALTYRAPASVHQHVEGQLDGDLALGPVRIPLTYAFTTDAIVAYHPAELAVALTLRPGAEIAVHGALVWQRYSGYQSPYARTTTRTATDLPPGVALPLPPDDPGSAPPAARFSNRFVPRLGVEKSFAASALLTLAARAGYAFEHSPVPTKQLDTLLFDMDRHVVGAGAGVGWRKPFSAVSEVRVDLGLQLVLGVGRRFESSGSAGSSSHDASGNVWSAGADLGLVFGDGSG